MNDSEQAEPQEPNQRDTPWHVDFARKAEKQAGKLPHNIREILYVLKADLEQKGPEQTGWQNYGLIVGAKDVHHCHLNNNRPRYVVVWSVTSREKQIIKIKFVGAHGSVNYRLF
jgi:mRNA-degrading endonuclease RelE of RelBE toxin-antitoxin system